MRVELNDPLFRQVSEAATVAGVRAYVVGGFVRDLFLNRPSKDVDIVVLGDGIALARAFAASLSDAKEVAYFRNFGTAMVKAGEWEVEFVGARRESYTQDSRKPQVEPGTLEEDQNRRDFTVNAMAASLLPADFGELLDPFDGRRDLAERILRTPREPDITFSDDPLRMLRAIRFASQLQFSIEPGTLASIRRNRERIRIVSSERISEELNKIILATTPSAGFLLLSETGLLELIFPELEAMKGVEKKEGIAHKDNFYHTLQVLDNTASQTSDLWLRWASILHDIAKPATKRFIPGEGWTFHGHDDRGSRMVSRIFRRLKLPLNEKMRFVEKLVALHHRPKALAEGVTDSAIRRLLVDAGEDLEALFILCRADMTSRNLDKIAMYRKNLDVVKSLVADVEARDRMRNWQPPVSGEEIMESFGIGPSREVGLIKSDIREAILEGRIRNDHGDARQLMLELGKKLGLRPVNA